MQFALDMICRLETSRRLLRMAVRFASSFTSTIPSCCRWKIFERQPRIFSVVRNSRSRALFHISLFTIRFDIGILVVDGGYVVEWQVIIGISPGA